MNRFFVSLIVGSLLIVGAGCKRASPPVATSTSTGEVAQAPEVVAKPAPTEAERRAELRQAIDGFKKVKSFRADVTVTPAQGKVTALLEYTKPNRFRGSIQIEKAGEAEMIAVSDALFMRVNGGSWANLSNTPSAKVIGETLRNALNGDSNLENIAVDESLPISVRPDAARGCELYTTQVRTTDNALNEVQVCVSEGLPRYLDLQTAQGPIALRYFDYNSLFLIEKPI